MLLVVQCVVPASLTLYSISSAIQQIFFLPKQSQKLRSILLDRSGPLGLFRKYKLVLQQNFIKLI